MNRLKLGDGGAVNMDHIVMLERHDGTQFARLLSGSTITLADVYPLAYEFFRVAANAWVNPVHVSIVDVGYNSGAAFKDVMASEYKDDTAKYMQVRVETVLGSKHEIWADLYGLDEVDYLAELLDGETND